MEGSPEADLGIVVVIPCHAEPDLLNSLEALWNCRRPAGAVEVLVVVNASAAASAAVRSSNEATLAQARAWGANHSDRRLQLHLLSVDRLPPKHAGVGLARKVGMDEAVRRLDRAGALAGGVIVGFDADCGCRENYLVEIESHFQRQPTCPGCSVYFEHPLTGELPARVYEAAARYELHLRYYVQALRWAGYPFAYQTIGSSMAVRAPVYIAQGGMNKRQAGEDFYFLHKVIPLGGFMDLNRTVVYPSARPSDRVPFGTGRAVRTQLEGATFRTYPWGAFQDLAGWFSQSGLERVERWQSTAPDTLRSFLEQQEFAHAWEEIKANTAELATRWRRWLRWFDGFRVMKFIHHARDIFYCTRSVEEEAACLLARLPGPGSTASGFSPDLGVIGLLEVFRDLARREAWGSGAGNRLH